MPQNIASFIDHTLLKAAATSEDFQGLAREAKEHQFYSVCVPPCWVEVMAQELKPEAVKVCTVVGFPLGYQTTITKKFETGRACTAGADEIDMVMNLSLFKSSDFHRVEQDIREVVEESSNHIVKVILETGHLSEDEIQKACQISERAGANFVKTSTGFGPRGAELRDIEIMKQTVGDRLGIKASGGISSWDQAVAMIDAGATRLGTSRSCQIVAPQSRSRDEDSSRRDY